MKISGIRPTVYRWKRPKIENGAHAYSDGVLLMVRVETDDGAYGLGWIGGTAAERPLELFVPFVDHYSRLLTGLDPTDPADRRRMHLLTDGDVKTFGCAGPHSQVSASFHNAVYDLRGKLTGQPVHALLGSKRKRVRAYIAGGYYQEVGSLTQLQEELAYNVNTLHAGAVKMKIGNPRVGLAGDVVRVRAAREAIGPETCLMIDANCAFSTYSDPLTEAMRYIEALAQFDITWFEEPFDPAEILLHAELAANTSIPIATGENIYRPGHFEALLQREAALYLNADVAIMGGGYDACMEVAALAGTYGGVIAPHGCQELQIHLLLAASANDTEGWLEVYPPKVDPLRDEIFPRTVCIGPDGFVQAPTLPGIGLTPSLEVLERYRVSLT